MEVKSAGVFAKRKKKKKRKKGRSMPRLEIPRRGRVYLKSFNCYIYRKRVMVDNTYIQDATLHENILSFNTKTFSGGILLLFNF